MRNVLLTCLGTCVVVALALGSGAHASILYSTVGGAYSESFDTLPNAPQNVNLQTQASPMMWADDTTPSAGVISVPGWYLYHPLSQTEGGTNGHQRMRIGAGTANTGAFMSWGAAAGTDRALGDLGSNTLNATPGVGGDIYLALRLTNNTGVVLDKFTLSYDGEQWRDGGSTTPNAQTMTFGWSTTATAVSDPNTAFTDVTALGFASPVFTNTGSGAAVDGNVAGKVAISAVTVTGINWQPNADLWLRWDDINNVGNDHGLGIDNVSFSADVPEPATLALLAVGLVPMLRRRK